VRPGLAVWRLAVAKPAQAAVWGLVVAAFVTTSAVRGDVRVWPYLTVVLVCTAIVAIADRAVGFGDGALWLLVLVGTAHLAGGLLPGPDGAAVLYDTWLVPGALRFDQLVHAVGSAGATVATWQLLGTWLDLGRTPARTQALVAALAGLGKGAINEVLEFAIAIGVPGTHVGGFSNTGWDLVFDVAGCAAAACFLVWSRAPRRPAPRPAAPRSLKIVTLEQVGFASKLRPEPPL
jgi:hypothetical protein